MRVLIFRRVRKRLRKATTNINFVMPVRPLETVRLKLKEFSKCFVARIFTKISQPNWSFVYTGSRPTYICLQDKRTEIHLMI